MELIEICKKFISINSVTIPNGTREIVDFLRPLFLDLGCSVKTQSLEVEGHANLNLLARLGPQNKEDELLINVHLDTVSPGLPEAWTICEGNPFQATIKDGFLHGLGSADTKLAMACLFIGLKKVLKTSKKPPDKWRNSLLILGTAGEERGLLGAQHALKEKIRAKYVLDSEPSELSIVWAHKGFCMSKIHFIPEQISSPLSSPLWRISFQGEPAHSSTPHLGKNAIQMMIDFLETDFAKDIEPLSPRGGNAPNVIPAHAEMIVRGKTSLSEFKKKLPANIGVEELTKPGEYKKYFLSPLIFSALLALNKKLKKLSRELRKAQKDIFDPPYSTTSTNILSVETGPSLRLILTQDLRFIRKGEGEEFISQMKTLSEEIMKQFNGIRIEIELERLNDPMHGDLDEPFIGEIQKILRKLGLPGDLKTKAGCTEGALFSAHGMKTIVIGPGRAENNIHKPNERVSVRQLHQAVNFYAETIQHFCV